MRKRIVQSTSRSAVVGALLSMLVLGVLASSSTAWERYDQGCNDCHGDFFSGVSPKGTTFPSNNKHEMHKSTSHMDAACNLCHGGAGVLVLDSSGGTGTNPGVGCVGCHGRAYDGPGDSGVGLRKHHDATTNTACVSCHHDDPEPLPESALPTYYGTTDTKIDEPCNTSPGFLENYSLGDTEGLDNDGDVHYDSDDGDCVDCTADVTGDSVVDVLDLLAILSAWGAGSGPEDINGDGVVDVLDLLEVLSAWEPCS